MEYDADTDTSTPTNTNLRKGRWKNYFTRERRVFYMPPSLLLLWFMWAFYVIIARLDHANQMNTIYKYTYFEPYNAPGNLTSDRHGTIYIPQIIISCIREFIMIITLVRLLFFRTKWIINMHMLFSFLAILAEAALAVLLGLNIESCNEEENNPCNSYKWCAVYASNTTTSCPMMLVNNSETVTSVLNDTYILNQTTTFNLEVTPVSWNPTVVEDDLKWNIEFTLAFAIALAMVLVTFLIWVFSVFGKNPTRMVKETYETIGGKVKNSSGDVGDIGFDHSTGDSSSKDHHQNVRDYSVYNFTSSHQDIPQTAYYRPHNSL